MMKYLGNGFTKDGRLYTLKTSKDHWGEVKRKKKTKESLAIPEGTVPWVILVFPSDPVEVN